MKIIIWIKFYFHKIFSIFTWFIIFFLNQTFNLIPKFCVLFSTSLFLSMESETNLYFHFFFNASICFTNNKVQMICTINNFTITNSFDCDVSSIITSMILYDFLSIFYKFELKSSILIMSLKKFECSNFNVYFFDISHLYAW